jgi:hypothetical protein
MVMDPARLGPESDCTANYRPVLWSESAPHFNNQALVRLKESKNLVIGPTGEPDAKTDWPTDRRSATVRGGSSKSLRVCIVKLSS